LKPILVHVNQDGLSRRVELGSKERRRPNRAGLSRHAGPSGQAPVQKL
jgi:hypothetical protein